MKTLKLPVKEITVSYTTEAELGYQRNVAIRSLKDLVKDEFVRPNNLTEDIFYRWFKDETDGVRYQITPLTKVKFTVVDGPLKTSWEA